MIKSTETMKNVKYKNGKKVCLFRGSIACAVQTVKVSEK